MTTPVSTLLPIGRTAAATGPVGTPPAAARTVEKPTRIASSDVRVTLSPQAREHLSRLEGFTATIGTQKQPKTMGKPGMGLDLRA